MFSKLPSNYSTKLGLQIKKLIYFRHLTYIAYAIWMNECAWRKISLYGMYSKDNLNHLLYIGKLETVHSVISVMSPNIRDIVKTSNATIGRFGTIVINLKTYLRYVNVCDNNYTCKNINMNYIVQQRFNKTKIPQIIILQILFNSMFLLLFHLFP